MAKTYNQIQAQIRTLQMQADALKAKEVPGVVARIQKAIAYYGLTAQDLFGETGAAARSKGAPKAAAKTAPRPAAPSKVARPAKAGKPPAPAKYQDAAGHQWSGIGKRPNWFKAALAQGKSAADLLIQPPTAG